MKAGYYQREPLNPERSTKADSAARGDGKKQVVEASIVKYIGVSAVYIPCTAGYCRKRSALVSNDGRQLLQ